MESEVPRASYDCIVVGAGPAGLSAALMLGRCRRTVLVCDAGEPRNIRSRAMHNYLSRDGTSPREFLEIAWAEVGRYSTVEFRRVEVLAATRSPDGFRLVCADGRQLASRKLLLATGVVDELPRIDGLDELYGTSVHHCPYCDGWEWRDRPIAVYGSGDEGSALVLCTDGPTGLNQAEVETLSQHGIQIRDESILRLEGSNGELEQIVFRSGDSLKRDALFVCASQHQRSGLARKLGCQFTSKGAVDTGTCEATNVPGLYVAGDSSKEAQFVIVAAAEGAEAGLPITKALLRDELSQNRTSNP